MIFWWTFLLRYCQDDIKIVFHKNINIRFSQELEILSRKFSNTVHNLSLIVRFSSLTAHHVDAIT